MPEFTVSFEPILAGPLSCPVCDADVAQLRREDVSGLAAVGAVRDGSARFYADPCGHRVRVVVPEFGAVMRLEEFTGE